MPSNTAPRRRPSSAIRAIRAACAAAVCGGCLMVASCDAGQIADLARTFADIIDQSPSDPTFGDFVDSQIRQDGEVDFGDWVSSQIGSW